jgi:tRNA pseudouridine55 synthase
MVNAIRRGTGVRRVGHAGTLDPLASGLLVVCLGSATRLSEYLTQKDKRYRARVRLGQTTRTYDAGGPVVAERAALPERPAVEAALAAFRGAQLQRPPQFSAIKRGGHRAYELARRGETVELEPRPITIFSLELVGWQPPECELEVHCSAGTYVRSLAHDLGQALRCGAHLVGLRRTASGAFRVDDAVSLSRLKLAFAEGPAAWRRYLRPADAGLADWPAVNLSAEEAGHIQHGQAISLGEGQAAGGWARAYSPAGEFIAVLRADSIARVWHPHKVLLG